MLALRKDFARSEKLQKRKERKRLPYSVNARYSRNDSCVTAKLVGIDIAFMHRGDTRRSEQIRHLTILFPMLLYLFGMGYMSCLHPRMQYERVSRACEHHIH